MYDNERKLKKVLALIAMTQSGYPFELYYQIKALIINLDLFDLHFPKNQINLH